MIFEQAAADRQMAWPQASERDWDALYADQLPRLYNYFRFRLGNAVDVEELTSRTFEKAWRGRERYRRDLGGFSTWLFTIAHNVALDDLRARREHLPLEAVPDLPAEGSPEQDAERGSDLERLARLTAQRVRGSPGSIGVFHYPFFDLNRDSLAPTLIDGVAPTAESIASGAYPGSGMLYLYVKGSSLRSIPGVSQFMTAFQQAPAPRGLFVNLGIVAPNEADRRSRILTLQDLQP